MLTIKNKAELHLYDRNNCSAVLHKPISELHICAVGEDNQDACKGDSGGPLVATIEVPIKVGSKITEKFHYLAGIVSFGEWKEKINYF